MQSDSNAALDTSLRPLTFQPSTETLATITQAGALGARPRSRRAGIAEAGPKTLTRKRPPRPHD